ncbi:unnamed protein product [Eruca vesicaria subsp. sativa]|uniref:Uncharacterized protein n=1 Tax=Eruca vesicaria subsp. sativa TaxID=29727 RepID=A0ABC8LJJ3_ERUVS|nr:unnamed protein product [Eruca vesicaria subsp. sativa]
MVRTNLCCFLCPTNPNVQLTEIVLELQKQMRQMKNFIKKMKRKAHARKSSFHTLLSRTKKHRTSHLEEQNVPPTHQSGVEPSHVKPRDIDLPTDKVMFNTHPAI